MEFINKLNTYIYTLMFSATDSKIKIKMFKTKFLSNRK